MKMRVLRIWALVAALSLLLTGCAGSGQTGESAVSTPAESEAAGSEEMVTSGFDPDNIVLGGRDAEGTTGVVSSGRLEASQLGV